MCTSPELLQYSFVAATYVTKRFHGGARRITYSHAIDSCMSIQTFFKWHDTTRWYNNGMCESRHQKHTPSTHTSKDMNSTTSRKKNESPFYRSYAYHKIVCCSRACSCASEERTWICCIVFCFSRICYSCCTVHGACSNTCEVPMDRYVTICAKYHPQR